MIKSRTKHQKDHHAPASTETPTHHEHTHSSHAVDEDNRNSHSRKNHLEKKERKIAMKYRLAVNLAGLAAVIIVGILSCAGNARAFPIQSIRVSNRALDTNYSKANAIDPTIIEGNQVKPFLADSIQVKPRAIDAVIVIDKVIAIEGFVDLKSGDTIRANTDAIVPVDLAVGSVGLNNINLDAINLDNQSPDLDPANSLNMIADMGIMCRIDDLNSLDRSRLEAF